jgi:hypothetical protein
MRSIILVVSAVAGFCVLSPALAQEVDVRIGHRDHDRAFGRAHAQSRTVVIRREHDRGWHRGWDRDRAVHRKVIIDR